MANHPRRQISAGLTKRLDAFASDGARWAAVLKRDGAADGKFWYAVSSTGVYCRPSCPARRPKRENVTFHVSAADASARGFRPCMRCTPDTEALSQTHARIITAACQRIDGAEGAIRLEDLAADAGLSPHYFHRLFKSVTGLTPKAYTAAKDWTRAKIELGRARSVTAALYDAGFSSQTRFYAKAKEALGMAPSSYHAGGTGLEISFVTAKCNLGRVLVAATEKGICAVILGDRDEALIADLEKRFAKARISAGDHAFKRLAARAVAVIDHRKSAGTLPLDIAGTVFQQRVWRALQEIPSGATRSYSDIARHIGAPKAVRAVASACGANPVAVIIPCHRVVGASGALSGYRWGLTRKRRLLDDEAAKAGGGEPGPSRTEPLSAKRPNRKMSPRNGRP